MPYLQTIEKQKTAYTNLLAEYNKTGKEILFQKYPEYTNDAQLNIQRTAKEKLKTDTLSKAEKLKSEIFKTLLEVQNSLLKSKYPMLYSAESALNQNRLQGTLEINNASTDLSRLENRDTIFQLLDNALRMNRQDYVSSIIDSLLAEKSIDVEITDSSIFVKPTDKNVNIYQSEQDFYSKLNEYRIGLKNMDTTLSELYFENKESLFLSENISVLIKVLQPAEQWLSHIFSGYDLQNMSNLTELSIGEKSLDSFAQINSIAKYYSSERQKSFLGM
jgi:hypothetical protein